MHKALKIKGEPSRLALVEHIVAKRVQFLKYLSDLHRIDGGVFWMGTVRISREDVARYFRPPATAQPAREIRVAVEGSGAIGDVSRFEIDVPMPALSSSAYSTSDSWLSTNLPCFVCLAVSLAELLGAPLTCQEFVECFYTMLLELDLRFAAGAATKALAMRNLRNHRRHIKWPTDGFATGSSNSHGGKTFANGVSDTEGFVKYLFINSTSTAYLPSPKAMHYEEIIVPVCAQLTRAYTRLNDVDVASREECTKRVLSIDHCLQRIFFGVVSKEMGKLARLKLKQQTWLLSTDGLFDGVGDSTKSSARGLLQGLQQFPHAASKDNVSEGQKTDSSSSHMREDSGEALFVEEL